MLPQALRSLVRTTPTIAHIPQRTVLSVTGSDASEFLNGIVAATVPRSPDRHFYTAILQAQGRIVHDAFAHAFTTPKGNQGFLLEYDAQPSEAEPLLTTLKRYILRAKVKIRDVSEEYDVWAAWGSERERVWETSRQWTHSPSGCVEPVWDQPAPWGPITEPLRDRRAIGMGNRVLSRKGDRPQGYSDYDVATANDYLRHRILHGVPEGNIDMPPLQALPTDSNMDFMGALDFRKGCYVGQELTVRTYHTGIVRKRLFPVQLRSNSDTTTQLKPGTDIRVRTVATSNGPPKPRPRGTGKLLSSIDGIALAVLRLEQVVAVEKGEATFYVQTADDESNEWAARPWRPDWWPELQSATD